MITTGFKMQTMNFSLIIQFRGKRLYDNLRQEFADKINHNVSVIWSIVAAQLFNTWNGALQPIVVSVSRHVDCSLDACKVSLDRCERVNWILQPYIPDVPPSSHGGAKWIAVTGENRPMQKKHISFVMLRLALIDFLVFHLKIHFI